MFIKKISLENIRSYKKININFNRGSTLLSGNIGSGKSSILLAIEFILFGFQKGISTETLLRHGEKDGSVELEFEINNQNYTIKRTLKSNLGYLVDNNGLTQLSVTELKQKILEILNYQKDFLTKKPLIYRFTVYTPQDEMKLILSSDVTTRLETLRKVFNVDKYKRIRDNSKIINSELRERKKEISGKIYDLESKKEKKLELINEKEELLPLIAKIRKTEQTIKETILEEKKIIEKIEKEIIIMNENKKQKVKLQEEINSKNNIISRNVYQINSIKKELEENIDLYNIDFKTEIKATEQIIDKIRKDNILIIEEIAKLNHKKENTDKIKSNISELDICPLCKQKVTIEYKNMVIFREDKELEKTNIDLNIYIQKLLTEEVKLKSSLSNLDDLRKKDKENEVIKIKLIERETKKFLLEKFEKENKLLQEDTFIFNKKLNNIIIDNNLEEECSNVKVIYELNLTKEKQILEEKIKLETKLNYFFAQIKILEDEIIEKELMKSKLIELDKLETFLSKDFTDLMALIEKKVMLKVHSEFNFLFKKWFKLLLEDELIEVHLDESLSPVILQDGHIIPFDNLSGGEKTTSSLAYRLALNQVVNNIIGNVNTKDLIILDEPTDGFSNEQIEKIKDILNELNMTQIIIVSHEPKIEDFVDNVIRIKKEEHISYIS
ncbi:AAA family ATPase [Candidatus Woesearchaeota archaeon]|nr:AAA family ATPase [Candidatus Woesearchaeota archaeon]